MSITIPWNKLNLEKVTDSGLEFLLAVIDSDTQQDYHIAVIREMERRGIVGAKTDASTPTCKTT